MKKIINKSPLSKYKWVFIYNRKRSDKNEAI